MFGRCSPPRAGTENLVANRQQAVRASSIGGISMPMTFQPSSRSWSEIETMGCAALWPIYGLDPTSPARIDGPDSTFSGGVRDGPLNLAPAAHRGPARGSVPSCLCPHDPGCGNERRTRPRCLDGKRMGRSRLDALESLGPDDHDGPEADGSHQYSMTKNKRSSFVSWTRPLTLRCNTIN